MFLGKVVLSEIWVESVGFLACDLIGRVYESVAGEGLLVFEGLAFCLVYSMLITDCFL